MKLFKFIGLFILLFCFVWPVNTSLHSFCLNNLSNTQTEDNNAKADNRQTMAINEPIVDVYHEPIPFRGGGKTILTYELHITNSGLEDMLLDSIQVFNGQQQLIKTYKNGLLSQCTARFDKKSKMVRLTKGWRSVVFIKLEFENTSDVPEILLHKIYFTTTKTIRKWLLIKHTVEDKHAWINVPVCVSNHKPVVIGPPVGDGIWHVQGCPGEEGYRFHRGSMRPFHGKIVDRARYAIDFSKCGSDNRLFQGAGNQNENWYGYGEDVVACAEGTVVAMHDGIPDNRLGSRSVPMNTLENIAGNFVIINIGQGLYAHYAHLKQNSIQVNEGEYVNRGDILGRIGNSGNSTAPHLHFHVCDGNYLLGEGMPFIFDQFEYLGEAENIRAFDECGLEKMSFYWQPPSRKSDVRQLEVPLENYLIQFGYLNLQSLNLSQNSKNVEKIKLNLSDSSLYQFKIESIEYGVKIRLKSANNDIIKAENKGNKLAVVTLTWDSFPNGILPLFPNKFSCLYTFQDKDILTQSKAIGMFDKTAERKKRILWENDLEKSMKIRHGAEDDKLTLHVVFEIPKDIKHFRIKFS